MVAFATASGYAQEVKGDAAAGAQKNAMCIGCHNIVGYKSSFPEVYKVPMISGQNAKYIIAALTEYKKGERKHPTMRGIADSLSEQDMADEGTRRTATMKLVRVVEGVSEDVNTPADGQLSLGDPDDDSFTGGPSFSGGDE